jgi:hypothetical protein
VQQVLEQLAIQTAGAGAYSAQTIRQIAVQVAAEDGDNEVSEAIFELAQREAAGEHSEVAQDIIQIAEQLAQGRDVSQALTQGAEQTIGVPYRLS